MKKIFQYLIGFVLVFIVILISFFSFFYEGTYQMMASSGLPNILTGEKIVANKFSISEIRRGELIILNCNGNKVVTRLIALPNDKISVLRDNRIIINDQEIKREEITTVDKMPFVREVIENKSYMVHPVLSDSIVEYAPIENHTLKSDEIFVLSDNRNAAIDSRLWLENTVVLPETLRCSPKIRDIVGKAWLVVSSPDFSRIGIRLNDK